MKNGENCHLLSYQNSMIKRNRKAVELMKIVVIDVDFSFGENLEI